MRHRADTPPPLRARWCASIHAAHTPEADDDGIELVAAYNGRAMNINGDITVKAPRSAVFDKLVDAPFFASCVEGVQDLTEVDARHYFAVMEAKVAYMRLKFKVAVEVVDIVPPHRIAAKIEGVPLGIVGRLSGSSVTLLSESGDETHIRYAIDVALT